MDGTADPEGSIRLIEVCPLEAADLAPPQAGSQLPVEDVIPDGILPDYFHELIQPRIRQHPLGLVAELWGLDLLDGIPRDDACLLRCPQCFVEHGMDAPDGTAGQPLASVPVLSLRQCFIRPLDVFPFDLGDGLVPQIGLDVLVHRTLIPCHGIGPDGPGDIPQPLAKPLSQSHPAPLGQV